jgi:hypothetical protein
MKRPVMARNGFAAMCGFLLALACCFAEAQTSQPRVAAKGQGESWGEPGPQVAAEMNVLLLRRADGVVGVGKPRASLFAAMVKCALHDDPDCDAWLHSATTAGNDDPVIWWMLLRVCDALHQQHCAPYRERAWQRLVELESDNAAMWLWRMQPGFQDKNTADEYLRRAATGKRFDDHARDLAEVLRDFYNGIEIPQAHWDAYTRGVGKEVARYVQMSNMLLSVNPPVTMQARQCIETPEARVPDEFRDDCLRLCALMSSSSTPITRRTGEDVCLRLARDVDARRFWAKQLLQTLWVDSHWGELYESADNDEKAVALFADRIRSGEFASQQHVLERAGVAMSPPAGWVPPRLSDDLRQRLHDAGPF